MKKKLLAFCLLCLLFLSFTSFTDDTLYLIGKWNITAVGTADPALIKKINKDTDSSKNGHYHKYLPELSSMMTENCVYEFLNEGVFKVTNKDNKEIIKGDYTISRDGEVLTLITDGVDTEYKLTKSSENHIKLKSKKDASTLELSKR